MSKKLMYSLIGLVLVGLAAPAAADEVKGYILVERWQDPAINNNLATLKAFPDFPDNPHMSFWDDDYDQPDVGANDYWGERYRGYLYPPQTGEYTFWIASDDDSELYLSTDDDPANSVLIASVTGWMPYQNWDGTGGAAGDNFQSDPIALEAGKKYYTEAMFSDGTGGANMSVGWGGPGIGAGPVVIAGKYLSPVVRDPEPMFQARNPSPADGAVGVTAPLLTWEPGATAQWHDFYFGTDPNPPLVGRQPFALYYHVPGLDPGVVYYWRVDEIEADGVTIHEGNLWSFVAQSLTAYYPNPVSGATSISPTTVLTWEAGRGATTHHLYLSTDADAVAQRAAAADQGTLEETTFDPGALQGGVTYYWAVDETSADGSIQTGEVWSFTTFILVDDFESYDDDIDAGTTIYQTWIDGWENNTGSYVGYDVAANGTFGETTIVHGGGQSMPLEFNNAETPYYSETDRTWATPQDWTVGGVTDLVMYVQGYPVATSVDLSPVGGAMSVTGDGRDIWDNHDEFTYAYRTLNGDGTMVARVTSIGPGTNTWAKGGVMIRQSLNGGSTHAMMVLTANTDGAAGNGASFQYRATTDGASANNDSVSVIAAPYWVKIERMGDTLSGFVSSDGNFWSTLGSTILVMEDPVYIGICVTSHEVGEDRTFDFSNISSTGAVSGQWQGLVINAPRHNSAADLYAAVQDSAGRLGLVTYPGGANLDTWTQWRIALSDLAAANVNLSAVKKMFIGVGDRDNPVPDGTGLVFIDDIRVENLPPDTGAEE